MGRYSCLVVGLVSILHGDLCVASGTFPFLLKQERTQCTIHTNSITVPGLTYLSLKVTLSLNVILSNAKICMLHVKAHKQVM